MLNMVGVVIENNVIVNTTVVQREIKPGEKYLCRFLNPPQFSRVCNIEEIQGWLLFANEAEGQAWIKANSQQPQLPEGMVGPPAPEPKDDGGNGADPDTGGDDDPSDDS